jgi:branched-chain amino acid transport system substrate-binding protein
MVVGSEVDWFMEQWQEERPPRFAFVTWDLPCGRDWITDEEIAYVKSKGMEYVGEEFIPASPIDTTTTLLRLKDKGVDVCSGFMYASAISVVLKDAERIDFHPMWFFGPGTDLIELASYVGPLANNVCACCSTYPMRYWEDKYPAMVETLKNKGRGEEYYQDSYAWGWSTWTIAMEGVRRAVEQAGAESVTGEDVYNAMFTIKEFDPIVGIPVTYTEEMHCGSTYVPLFIARNGELEVIGPCSFPDIIPGGKDVPTEYMP